MSKIAKKKAFSTGKGNTVVSVPPELMQKLRNHRVKTGVSITHFTVEALEEKFKKMEEKSLSI